MNLKDLANGTIPAPENHKALYKAEGNTGDIMTEVMQCYIDTKDQLQAFAPHLQGRTVYETCRNIWQFIKGNIAYRVDPPGVQWIKTPARLWADKKGDCKSYSVFTAACLHALGIKGAFRFVSFTNSTVPTHVYCVVKERGKEIKIDAVLGQFDAEKKFVHKHDYNMSQIYRLSGVEDSSFKIPVRTDSTGAQAITVDDMNNAILKERLEIEKQFLTKKISGIGAIGAGPVAAQYENWISEVDAALSGAPGVGNIFKKVGNAVKKAAQGVAKGATAVAKTVVKVATLPIRLAAKGILEIELPKSAMGFLYLFITSPAAIEKLPASVKRKRDKQIRTRKFIVDIIGMQEDHFMGIIRNNIMKKVGTTPEQYLANELKMQVAGIGVIPFAALGVGLGLISKLIQAIQKIFGKKPDEDVEDADATTDDWAGWNPDESIPQQIEQQPTNKTMLEKVAETVQNVSPQLQTIVTAVKDAKASTDLQTTATTPVNYQQPVYTEPQYYEPQPYTANNTGNNNNNNGGGGLNNNFLMIAMLGLAAFAIAKK